jgi:hypothetical protein
MYERITRKLFWAKGGKNKSTKISMKKKLLNVNERLKRTVIGLAGLKIQFLKMVGKVVQYCIRCMKLQ